MKKIFMVSVLILLLSVVVSPVFSDEMAKEGSGSGHGYYIGNLTVLPFGKTTLQMNYEAYGISVTDTGKGLFHNASQQILGGMRIVDGVITDSGFIIATLTSGDKVFMTYKASGKIVSERKFRILPHAEEVNSVIPNNHIGKTDMFPDSCTHIKPNCLL